MTESENIDRVVAALTRAPARSLKIIELTNQLTSGKGELDLDALADRQPEVNLAVAEARAYGQATSRAVEALNRLEARVGDV